MNEPTEITPDNSAAPVFLDDTPLEPVQLTSGSTADQRLAAYQQRSDPLFFKWQRGEATQQEWLDEVEAIRAEIPLQ